ncbi:MAG: hypothetical protein IJL32_02520 [Oscillospiraceae bacterium]|nr:hypothetical protein [Oscillospiraceae bacterium]
MKKIFSLIIACFMALFSFASMSTITASADTVYSRDPVNYIAFVNPSNPNSTTTLTASYSVKYNPDVITYDGYVLSDWYYDSFSISVSEQADGWMLLTASARYKNPNSSTACPNVFMLKFSAIDDISNVRSAFNNEYYNLYNHLADYYYNVQSVGNKTSAVVRAMGDIDADFIIESDDDCDEITKYIASLPSMVSPGTLEFKLANVNFSAYVDISDAVLIASYAANSASYFWAPVI